MRFDRGFFGLPIFIFPPFIPGFRRNRGDFNFDERDRRRNDNDRHGHHDNHGFDNRSYR
jgi:hypothetical protein